MGGVSSRAGSEPRPARSTCGKSKRMPPSRDHWRSRPAQIWPKPPPSLSIRQQARLISATELFWRPTPNGASTASGSTSCLWTRPVLCAASPMPFGEMAERPPWPNLALSAMPIGKRFRDVRPADRICTGKVRDRPRDPQYARSSATREPQPVHGLLDQSRRFGCEDGSRRFLETSALLTGPGRPMSVTDNLTRHVRDSVRDHGTSLATGSMCEFRGGGGLNFHREIDPVQNRPTDAIAMIPHHGARNALHSLSASPRYPHRQGFIAATSWMRAG